MYQKPNNSVNNWNKCIILSSKWDDFFEGSGTKVQTEQKRNDVSLFLNVKVSHSAFYHITGSGKGGSICYEKFKA